MSRQRELGRRVSGAASSAAGGGASEAPVTAAPASEAPASAAIRGASEDPGPAGPVLHLRRAAKAFGAVRALADGSIELSPGEAHGLVGENGAGKSTLVKILAGVYQPDAGDLIIDGEPVTLPSPSPAPGGG